MKFETNVSINDNGFLETLVAKSFVGYERNESKYFSSKITKSKPIQTRKFSSPKLCRLSKYLTQEEKKKIEQCAKAMWRI